MVYEKFVKEVEKLIEQHADKLSLMEPILRLIR